MIKTNKAAGHGGNKARGGPKPKRRRNTVAIEVVAASLVLDDGKSYEQAAQETGVGSVQVIKTAVAREQGRREALEAQIDPATLSPTGQKKFDTALRHARHKLEIEYERRVQDAIRERMERVLQVYAEEQAEYRRVIKARKGVMDRSTYKKILSCLHPDRVQDHSIKKRYEEAFRLFTELEKLLLDDTESPTQFAKMPTTYQEWAAMKERAKAKRANGSAVRNR